MTEHDWMLKPGTGSRIVYYCTQCNVVATERQIRFVINKECVKP